MAESEKQGQHAHIRCRTIIEVLGKPKEHVEKAIKEYVEHIKEDSELVILNEDYSETNEIEKTITEPLEEMEQKDLQKDKKMYNLWGKFVELELVVNGTKKLISFCFEYMPSSIEVVKPENLIFTNAEFSNFLNDLQARLHDVDMVVKKQKAENDFLKHNMGAILHNVILISLKISSLSLEQLSSVTGVDKQELQAFVDKLMQENKIKKQGDIYSLT
ncbi:hypothetical protein HYY70_05840 [Candidatus Woesearchaeota archaeon]|nr:hypothetical protein [Candidatus Woesearchaeota archaeon]